MMQTRRTVARLLLLSLSWPTTVIVAGRPHTILSLAQHTACISSGLRPPGIPQNRTAARPMAVAQAAATAPETSATRTIAADANDTYTATTDIISADASTNELENIVPPTNSTVVAEVLVTPLEVAVAPKVDDSPFTQKEYSRVQTDYHLASVSELDLLMEKFRGRLVHCVVPWHPYCDIYLCGTLHVAKSSTDMVREAVRCIGPDFVVVEVCEARIDNLCEPEESAVNITFSGVVRNAIGERSFKQLAMGLLSWMQAKAAKGMDSQLGGELAAATKEGVRAGATIVLGDRLYAVTIQRIFDRLHFFEKIKLAGIMTWEVVTMSLTKLREYVHKSENEDDFVRSEIEKFGKHLPSVADVIINERDEYLAQTILETARVGVRSPVFGQHRRGRIVAVVGAGHLDGIQRWLGTASGVTPERIAAISSSSKHAPTWPGAGVLSTVNGTALYPGTGTGTGVTTQ